MGVAFQVTARAGAARTGLLETPHGAVATPAFMPVATAGAVKGVLAPRLSEVGAEIMLSNLYHLSVRPGIEVIEAMGGLHRFSGWPGPILTDSGGYQVFSLARLAEVDDDGVTFRNHVDGAAHRLTPEDVVERQRRLGVDVAMVLDECPSWPLTEEVAAASAERTRRWAERSRAAWPGGPGGLFGIVQGSVFRELRERAAAEITGLDFDGYGIGGVSVGEPGPERRLAVEWTAPRLPEGKPRYLMGVGYPGDILHAVRCGVDLFDCVLPSRNARHGLIFTRGGTLKIRHAEFRSDERPLDDDCACPTCRAASRALVHHLLRTDGITGKVMATLHNLRFYLDFMMEIRQAIASGALDELPARFAIPIDSGGGHVEAGSSRPDPAVSVASQQRRERLD